MIADMASAVLVLLIVGVGLGGTAAVGAAIAQDASPHLHQRLRRGGAVVGAAAAEFVVMAVAGLLVVASLFVGPGDDR